MGYDPRNRPQLGHIHNDPRVCPLHPYKEETDADGSVAGTGFNAPQATFETMMDIREFNMRRIPYFKAWGILAFLGDVAIWVASTSVSHIWSSDVQGC